MMPQTQTKPNKVTRHRAARPAKPAKATTPHKPGSPPNLCVVASPDELAYIQKLGWGKAATVHAAMRLLREVQSGDLKLSGPTPAYITTDPKQLKIRPDDPIKPA